MACYHESWYYMKLNCWNLINSFKNDAEHNECNTAPAQSITTFSIMIRRLIILLVYMIPLSSFATVAPYASEYNKLQKLEQRALRNRAGKIYVADLAGREDCNKTRIKYLGVVHTRQGRSYKILTSFFVFGASSTCHGSSHIKIFDMKNRFIGSYNVGMPEGLPDILRNNKLLYLENTADCNLRKTRSINLNNGLPGRFFVACTANGGDEYVFSSGE